MDTPAEVTRDAFLGGKVMAWQPAKGYRAGVDAVFLAAACPA
ncbi:MAG: methyltransferase, partial [Pseudomonadota bacterium]